MLLALDPRELTAAGGWAMQITVGGVVALAIVALIWVFAAAVANNEACASLETASYMSGPVKALMRLALLCWLV